MTTEEVSAITHSYAEEGIPVTPWGAGTSTGRQPAAGAWRPGSGHDVDRIIAIRPQDLQADVQPGVFVKPSTSIPVDQDCFSRRIQRQRRMADIIANNASGVQPINFGATSSSCAW